MRICVGLLVLLALGGVSCGGDDDSLPPQVNHPVADAIDRLQEAFVAEDYDAMCKGLTAAAADHAGRAGHGQPTTCQRDLRRLFRMIDKGGGWRNAGDPRVIDVQVDGSKAIAIVASDPNWRARVPMTRVDGRWKLSGFFGILPESSKQVVRTIVDADFPPAGGAPVTVSDEAGRPCPRLSDTYPTPSGGCVVELTSRLMPVTIATALGDFRFDNCGIDYRVRVDSSGRTWSDDFQVRDDPEGGACEEIGSCHDFTAEEDAPWRGRIYTDGSDQIVHRADICIGTCVGYFVGQLTLRLTRDGRGWRAEPMNDMSDSGFAFDEALKVDGDLAIDRAGDA